MFLRVKGIGKIQDSRIEMKGITVIAGENNSGKSTFGKVLYCSINLFQNLRAEIKNERCKNIERIILRVFPKLLEKDLFSDDDLVEDIVSLARPVEELKIREVINEYKNDNQSNSKNFEIFISDLKESINVNDNEIEKIIIARKFSSEFFGQINHINYTDSLGIIEIEDDNIKLNMEIIKNEFASITKENWSMQNAIYIDTPFIIDDPQKNSNDAMFLVDHRYDLFCRFMSKKNITAVEEALIKKKIENLLMNIKMVVDGSFSKSNNTLVFLEKGLEKPTALSNTSAGIKMFLIIKRLLELGEIRDRGILILDEPEIHLHPAWQLKFAEILVLLQKEFNLTILLTTHSPYFLNAIEVYSEKHRIKDRANYYLAGINGDSADVRDVTENPDEIYKQLAGPVQTLEDISYGDN